MGEVDGMGNKPDCALVLCLYQRKQFFGVEGGNYVQCGGNSKGAQAQGGNT
ncbi:hypothetical protein GCM10011318_15020 [Phaeocystidibacter marisrubri]|nr:hypothetical protein GCM10011318_15020 [Phaeocystidibacter marisrubri]